MRLEGLGSKYCGALRRYTLREATEPSKGELALPVRKLHGMRELEYFPSFESKACNVRRRSCRQGNKESHSNADSDNRR